MINVEIKAVVVRDHADRIREKLLALPGTTSPGTDHQIDTYFMVPKGRLKLRQGTIERTLIAYNRPDLTGPKTSKYTLVPVEADAADRLKKALTVSCGVLAVVDKKREIYFNGNVKFHLDVVEGLGSFVEIEARDEKEEMRADQLMAQVHHYLGLFQITRDALMADSYSDMILNTA